MLYAVFFWRQPLNNAIEMIGITKTFPGVIANNDVSISVKENECIIDDDNSIEEEKVRKKDRIDELKRERERLISLRENKEINKTKVKKKKK